MATKLTDKQKDVLGHLQSGHSVKEVGEILGISTNGVYGHVRKIKAAGVRLSVSKAPAAKPKAAPVAANGNGHVDRVGVTHEDVKAMIHAAQKAADDRVAAIDRETANLNAELALLSEERDRLTTHGENYKSALTTLDK